MAKKEPDGVQVSITVSGDHADRAAVQELADAFIALLQSDDAAGVKVNLVTKIKLNSN